MTNGSTEGKAEIAKAPPRPVVQLTIDHFARFFYWVSLMLLLVGAWMLIDPLHRQPSETAHIYVTVGAFEVYIWLLLVLARWQRSKNLVSDAARSGVFAAVLSSLLFMAINEMHMASATAGVWICIAAVVLTVIRLFFAGRCLGLSLPWPYVAAACAWIAVMALPPAIIRSVIADSTTDADRTLPNAIGLLSCWVVALLAGGHLGLVAWEKRRGWLNGTGPLDVWWTPWVLLVILAAAALAQLLGTMWGMYVEWAYWYLTPFGLAFGVVAVALSHARGQRRQDSWAVMILMLLCACVAASDPMPQELPLSWREGFAASLAHPVYPHGALVSVLFAVTVWVLHRYWLIGMALATPIAMVLIKILRTVWPRRYGKAAIMLSGAFVLLCLGALLQWWAARRRAAAGDGDADTERI